MKDRFWIIAAGLLLAVFAIALLATLTEAPEDPCADPQQAISGAVLADEPGDQDALTNRAMLERARCEQRRRDAEAGD